MQVIVGNIIVIAALLLLIGVCLRTIVHDIKKGGCAGCSGSCGACSSASSCCMDASKAEEILKNIKKPEKTK